MVLTIIRWTTGAMLIMIRVIGDGQIEIESFYGCSRVFACMDAYLWFVEYNKCTYIYMCIYTLIRS